MTRYSIAANVAWVSEEGLDAADVPTAYVTRVPSGLPLLLEGSGCLVWLAISDGGTADEILTTVAEIAEVEPDTVREDVETLIEQLVIVGVVAEE